MKTKTKTTKSKTKPTPVELAARAIDALPDKVRIGAHDYRIVLDGGNTGLLSGAARVCLENS